MVEPKEIYFPSNPSLCRVLLKISNSNTFQLVCELLLIDLDYLAQNKIVYKLHITTSDIAYAGTDANVFINIFGDEAETGCYF